MSFDDVLILLVLILLSAFFSGSEIAYVVSNKLKLEVRARGNKLSAKSALYYIQNPQTFFSTILIGNSIVNIAFASITTLFLTTIFGLGEVSVLIISSFILLIFGELIPKYFSRELSDRIILMTALPLRVFSFLLSPLTKITSSISLRLTQSEKFKEENINLLFDKEDIESLVKESHEAGVVNKKESDIINKVLSLGDQKVYEAMRPRTEIVGVEIDQNVDEALSIFIESGYSKLPVYEENLDNIRGVIFAYDIFKLPNNIKSMTREILFVPDTKKSIDMLNEFLNKHVSIAAVVDEFGGTAGIVTMEDIIEELFGEIKDEYDIEEDICKKISEKNYLISGKVEIDFINEKFQLEIPFGDYETIAGYITARIGRIPIQGENVKIDNFNITIIRSSQIKIDLVKVLVLSETESKSEF
ncbi:MAG TPA: hemolysin family protein [Ignavibacteriaceae bacterium]|nr:hemolysin family protein [Ignavibacteriaceae bacterium]